MTTETEVSGLLELAAKVEAAEGPDRELDAAIAEACGWKHFPRYGEDRWQHPETLMVHVLSAYTASIDAALTLVPEGWTRLLDNTDGKEIAELFKDGEYIPRGSHPSSFALAICAAALRSRATKEPRK